MHSLNTEQLRFIIKKVDDHCEKLKAGSYLKFIGKNKKVKNRKIAAFGNCDSICEFKISITSLAREDRIISDENNGY